MGISIDDLPAAFRDQARRQLLGVDAPITDARISDDDAKARKALDRAEKALQQLAEDWLGHHGYVRLTADNAVRYDGQDVRGWFGHLNKPRGNPLMPDLFVFDNRGRALLLELKTRNKWQTGQKELEDRGLWQVAWTFADIERIVIEWEVGYE